MLKAKAKKIRRYRYRYKMCYILVSARRQLKDPASTSQLRRTDTQLILLQRRKSQS